MTTLNRVLLRPSSLTGPFRRFNRETFGCPLNPTKERLVSQTEEFSGFKCESSDCGVLSIRSCTVEVGDAGGFDKQVRIGRSFVVDRILEVHSSRGRGHTATDCTQPAHVLAVCHAERARSIKSDRRD